MLVQTERMAAKTVSWSPTMEELLGDPRTYPEWGHDVDGSYFNPIDPEPCDTCDLGISMFVSYDGIRRCRNCVDDHAGVLGWNEVGPDEPQPERIAEVGAQKRGRGRPRKDPGASAATVFERQDATPTDESGSSEDEGQSPLFS